MKSLVNFEDYWPEENKVEVSIEVVRPELTAEKVNPNIPASFKSSKGLEFTSDELGTKISSKIPPNGTINIFYKGFCLGIQFKDFDLLLVKNQPYVIQLKKEFPMSLCWFCIGRRLTLHDFKVLPNSNLGE